MKKRSKEAALLDGIIMELHEVKCHIANERPFEAGVGLGGLMNALCHKLEKCEEKNEEVQGEESDEECEEGSEEEDFDWEAAHDLVEQENCNLRKTLKQSDEKLEEFECTKKALFELQDLIIKLIQIKKIDKTETKTVIDALKSTGISQGDIEVRCHAKIR